MRGAWVGFSWGHKQAHFLRATLESIAYEYAYYLKILRDQLPDLDFLEVRAVGGGARSGIWNQIKADVLGVPYQRLQRSELGTWGSAMIAGKAVGLFNDLAAKASESALPKNGLVMPDAAKCEDYRPLVEKYIALKGTLGTFFD
jgi:xylulokinase